MNKHAQVKTMENTAKDQQAAMDAALMWYAVSAYQALGRMERKQVAEVAEAASELSQCRPLWHYHKEEFTLPHIQRPLTGLHVMAYMTVSVDLLSGGQITDRDLSGFNKWLVPAKRLAQILAKKDTGTEATHKPPEKGNK